MVKPTAGRSEFGIKKSINSNHCLPKNSKFPNNLSIPRNPVPPNNPENLIILAIRISPEIITLTGMYQSITND